MSDITAADIAGRAKIPVVFDNREVRTTFYLTEQSRIYSGQMHFFKFYFSNIQKKDNFHENFRADIG